MFFLIHTKILNNCNKLSEGGETLHRQHHSRQVVLCDLHLVVTCPSLEDTLLDHLLLGSPASCLLPRYTGAPRTEEHTQRRGKCRRNRITPPSIWMSVHVAGIDQSEHLVCFLVIDSDSNFYVPFSCQFLFSALFTKFCESRLLLLWEQQAQLRHSQTFLPFYGVINHQFISVNFILSTYVCFWHMVSRF